MEGAFFNLKLSEIQAIQIFLAGIAGKIPAANESQG